MSGTGPDHIIDGNSTVLTKRVGLLSVLALVVGNAISVPIYVLSGPLAGSAGPSVIIAVVLAAIPAGFVVLYNALLGSAIPVAGGLYVYISRLTAPYWGFLVSFTLPLVIWASLLVTAAGFAEYTRYFIDLPAIWLIYGLLLLVLAINLVGLRLVAQFQILVVGGLVAALLVFIVPGAFHTNPGNYTPLFPDLGAFAIASVALFYPFLGFGLLIELGEEIDNPGRTIPIALFCGVVIVAVFYVALIAVLVGVVPFTELGSPIDVAVAAERFLPPWGTAFVALGAIFAVVTSINTSLLIGSRTIMRTARDGIFPESLSQLHPRFETPHRSLFVLGVPPLVLVPLADDLIGLSAFIGLASLTAYFFSAIGLWNLPNEFPNHYANASFRLRRRGLLGAVLCGAFTTGLYWAITLVQRPIVGIVLSGWFLIGYGYYRYRLRGVDAGEMYRTMTTLDDHERAFTSDTDGRTDP